MPNVVCDYYARSTLTEVGRLFYRYGSSKPALAWKHRRVRTWRQLVPPAFVLGLAGTATLSLLLHEAAILFVTPALVYVSAVAGFSLYAGHVARGGRGGRARGVAALAVVFPVVHVCYGVGFLSGAVKLAYQLLRPARRKTAPSSTRR